MTKVLKHKTNYPSRKEQYREAWDLKQQGLSYAEIGKKLGVSGEVIRYRVKTYFGLEQKTKERERMSEKGQYKSYMTRKFRADLHYRLKLLTAMRGTTMEEVFNDVVEEGLRVLEGRQGKVKGVGEGGK